MNHLLVPAFGIKSSRWMCSRGRFTRPDHERLTVDGQPAALHFAKNHIIGQALVSLSENIGVITVRNCQSRSRQKSPLVMRPVWRQFGHR